MSQRTKENNHICEGKFSGILKNQKQKNLSTEKIKYLKIMVNNILKSKTLKSFSFITKPGLKKHISYHYNDLIFYNRGWHTISVATKGSFGEKPPLPFVTSIQRVMPLLSHWK